MLNIYLGEMENVLHNVETYFKNQMEPAWLENELAVKMVADVDKSIVKSPYCIESPVMGQISPERLSGGVKALILIQNEKDRVINASNCGDNCAKWLLEMGKTEEITINLNHIMQFAPEPFEIKILNENVVVHNMKEFVEVAVRFL